VSLNLHYDLRRGLSARPISSVTQQASVSTTSKKNARSYGQRTYQKKKKKPKTLNDMGFWHKKKQRRYRRNCCEQISATSSGNFTNPGGLETSEVVFRVPR
jgi:hypothetical protein